MEDVLNCHEFEPSHPEILATFMDGLLRGRKGPASLTESQVEDALEGAVQLFELLAVRTCVLVAPPAAFAVGSSAVCVVFCDPGCLL